MSRSTMRDAAVLLVGAAVGAGGLYAAQTDPAALPKQALGLYAKLMGGEGAAHAEGAGPSPAAVAASGKGEKDEHGHDHADEPGKDHSKDDGHDHGKDSHGQDDGHGHDKPKAEAAPSGEPAKVAAADKGKKDEHGHDHADDPGAGHAKDDGHDHSKDGEHSKEDGHDHGEGGHGDELPEGVVEIDDARAKAAGIALGKAGPATLREELQLNGVVQANQEATVQVTPRFPGVVKSLAKRLGDQVKKGDLLAVVESNQSLTTYELRAPIAGVVTARQASLGEYVSEQKPAFVVTDLSTLWVDFSVYRRDIAKVSIGETVRIDPEDGGAPVQAKISYVSPIGSSDTQSALARAVIQNDDRFKPGLFATGTVSTEEYPAPLAVSSEAIQSVEGREVVFVREGDRFAARDVAIGRRDANMVEVRSGLKPGDAYAAKNSFVVKAELAKGEAGHDH